MVGGGGTAQEARGRRGKHRRLLGEPSLTHTVLSRLLTGRRALNPLKPVHPTTATARVLGLVSHGVSEALPIFGECNMGRADALEGHAPSVRHCFRRSAGQVLVLSTSYSCSLPAQWWRVGGLPPSYSQDAGLVKNLVSSAVDVGGRFFGFGGVG